MRIAHLAEASEYLPAIARAHRRAFGGLAPEWSQQAAIAELHAHTLDDRLPSTWVALASSQWLGSVSLLDADEAVPSAPRLASLYVRPQARGRGIGAGLVAHCVQVAACEGLRLLHLYCLPALQPFYQRLGWHTQTTLLLGPMPVVVMAIAPGARNA
ncbi:GNAT family N-acetyltransferase [Xanthomonas maliensis]|uniref:GNAT family N-acetyltransferase n=1 Tax=Xanthomonas maliensis TaxID=1321368 RepID=UPI0003A73C5F|nr:GNAT family N-acetyltransferase [Xanthomonas maliensis]KAB7765476.1 N-acetyltransferase [Xanthomonas maliensis]